MQAHAKSFVAVSADNLQRAAQLLSVNPDLTMPAIAGTLVAHLLELAPSPLLPATNAHSSTKCNGNVGMNYHARRPRARLNRIMQEEGLGEPQNAQKSR